MLMVCSSDLVQNPYPAMTFDHETLKAALAGYQATYAELTKKMDEIKRRLGPSASTASVVMPAPKKRVLSVAARKKIAAAQRKRWEAYRANANR
jgi:hypothetical protein